MPQPMSFAHRTTAILENEKVRLSLLPGGGHIAALTLRANGVNPLWDPVWATIDPSAYDETKHPDFGGGAAGKVLAGIVGHNLCFDIFGPPSDAEAAAGLTVHGEASVEDWDVESQPGELRASVELPLTRMRVERRLQLGADSQAVRVTETVESLLGIDRPVGWTQHVTLGPPFLAKGKTVFHAPLTRSKVYEKEFAPDGLDRFERGAEFLWPMAPLAAGGASDMRVTVDSDSSGALTGHLIDPSAEQGFFTAYYPGLKTSFGYVWRRSDFPWMCIWEENSSRTETPWNGQSLTRGLEFGVSPFAETREEMVARSEMFGERCYRWIPARSKVAVEYCLFIAETGHPLETVEWKEGKVRGSGGFELAV